MKYKIFILFMLVFVMTSCASKEKAITGPVMDIPADDGKYYYTNKDLGFALTFPEEFIYYQFQRVGNLEYTDLEYFVPTNDVSYPQELKSYAKPVVLRVYEKTAYEEKEKDGGMGLAFEKIGESKDKVYLIKFWDKIPNDWSDKWSPDLQSQIKNSFVILK